MQELYEALDKDGLPYMRNARIISELPWAMRRGALDTVLPVVSQTVGIAASQHISFGVPVYPAFGLNAKEAQKHTRASLLMLSGGDISLDIVPGFASVAT